MGYRNYESSIPLQKGGVVERETVGSIRPKPEDGQMRHEDYRTAMEKVRDRQPYSPENPTVPFARDLRIEIIDLMGLEDPNQYSRIRVYTAVGSAFDYYHGVDAFVEVDVDEEKGTAVVTIDITTRNKEMWKADICVEFPPDNLDPDLDETEYLSMIAKTAKAVVRKVNGDAHTKQYIS